MKNLNKKIVFLASALVFSFAFAAVNFAQTESNITYFNDAETSTGNNFTADTETSYTKAEQVKLTIESFPPATLPTVSKIIEIPNPNDQVEIAKQAALFANSAEGWNLSGSVQYRQPPGWSGHFSFVHMIPTSAETLLGYPWDSEATAYGGGYALYFHTDEWCARGGHDMCETANNYGVISGGLDGAFSRCAVSNWGRFKIKPIPPEENQPPVANFTYFPEKPYVGQEITFDASSSYDPDDDPLTYKWDFDASDGIQVDAEGEVVTNAYTKAGKYTIILTVIDDKGLPNSKSSKSEEIKIYKKELIVNIGSGRCLNAQRNEPYAPIVISDCISEENQPFTFKDDNSIGVYGNMCLDTSMTSIVIKSCNGSPSQKWTLDVNNRLVNDNGQCAEVFLKQQGNGVQLVLESCNRHQSQQFVSVPKNTRVEQCFGGVGSKCAPRALMGTRHPDGTQKGRVSVGSIAHDNCCLKNPNGTSCQSFNSNNHWGAPCKAEWEKAWNNQIKGRYWRHTWEYNVTNYADDLTPTPAPNRLIGLPYPDGGFVITYLEETNSTRLLAAPRNTKLDATDIDFCESKRATYKKGYLICE